jgi:hypothetical protein
VVVPLVRGVRHNSRLFQEILGYVGASDDPSVELDLQVLAEPRRVVVTKRLGVSETFKERRSLKDLLSDLLKKRKVLVQKSKASRKQRK